MIKILFLITFGLLLATACKTGAGKQPHVPSDTTLIIQALLDCDRLNGSLPVIWKGKQPILYTRFKFNHAIPEGKTDGSFVLGDSVFTYNGQNVTVSNKPYKQATYSQASFMIGLDSLVLLDGNTARMDIGMDGMYVDATVRLKKKNNRWEVKSFESRPFDNH